ncbi:pyroglutamyl-peptidase I [Salinicoccus halodurans]|uniref:Pyroglutamyl-peptidase I n=1 Tax=Salinicoccus halodurans TaxID=407035 RepID=A0A0F7HN54_9STAP|nr:pyroglutamyl-peptidase I [Salinicoccus halodurans]AKG74579.1 peptidase C15 [Salinicoccus halodurans]SFK89582.1 pyroglutamyl-peptidase [Salinicoccus halodurans]
MKKLLLTGFEPFLKFRSNPTEAAVRELGGLEIGEYAVTGKVYPVVFDKIDELITNDIKEEQPDAVICLGLAGGRHTIHIERIAINCIDGRPDNDGFNPDGEKIDETGPDGLFSTLPVKKLEAVLKEKEIPAKISNTAGTYLCNNVMYSALNHIRKNDMDIRAGFIHIPAHHEIGTELDIPSWSQEDITRAVRTIIEKI